MIPERFDLTYVEFVTGNLILVSSGVILGINVFAGTLLVALGLGLEFLSFDKTFRELEIERTKRERTTEKLESTSSELKQTKEELEKTRDKLDKTSEKAKSARDELDKAARVGRR